MIVQLRIDERLIHGQITTAWSRFLDVSRIVVASDKLAKDELTTQTLLMSAPAGKKVAVRDIEATIKLLSDPRINTVRVLVIVDNPKDAVTLVKALGIEEVNVANYVKKKSKDKVKITTGVNSDPEDLVYFKELAQVTKHCFSQLIPSSPVEDFVGIVAKL